MKSFKRLIAGCMAMLLTVLYVPWNGAVLAEGDQTIVFPDQSEYPIVQSDARPEGIRSIPLPPRSAWT